MEVWELKLYFYPSAGSLGFIFTHPPEDFEKKMMKQATSLLLQKKTKTNVYSLYEVRT